MADGRLRLREWLEAKLNAGTIPNFTWVDEERTMFKIPWKHGSKQGWDAKDAALFTEWAKHTGRYIEDQDTPDYAKFKTRLRCALNKATDIQEVKETRDTEFRVYKLLPRSMGSSKRSNTASPNIVAVSSPDSTVDLTSPDVTFLEATDEPLLPTIVDKLNRYKSGEAIASNSFPSDLDSCPSGDMIKMNSGEMFQAINEGMSTMKSDDSSLNSRMEHDAMEFVSLMTTPAYSPQEQQPLVALEDSGIAANGTGEPVSAELDDMLNMSPIVSLSSLTQDAIDILNELQSFTLPEYGGHEMYMELQYLSTVVVNHWVKNTAGARISSGNDSYLREHAELIADQLIGSSDLEHVIFPPCNDTTCPQQLSINKILPFLEHGIILECTEGNIYATRLCRCRVFFTNFYTSTAIPLVRRERTLIFDYNQFLQNMAEIMARKQNMYPGSEVQLRFGQDKEKGGIDTVLIVAKLSSVRAMAQLQKVGTGYTIPNVSSGIESFVQISNSDEYDRFITSIRDCNINTQLP